MDICLNKLYSLNDWSSYDVTDDGINNSINDMQFIKQSFPIDFNDDGFSNFIWVNEEQSAKAFSPIFVIEDGIVICFKDEHPAKVKSPIIVTENGIDICVNSIHSEKASSPIVVTEEGIDIHVNEHP